VKSIIFKNEENKDFFHVLLKEQSIPSNLLVSNPQPPRTAFVEKMKPDSVN